MSWRWDRWARVSQRGDQGLLRSKFTVAHVEVNEGDFKHIDDVLESIDPRGQLWWDLKEGEAPIMADEDFFEMKEGAKDLPDFDDARYLDDCEDFEEHYSEEEGECDDCED